MQTRIVKVHEAEEEGGYWAEVEELPGCFGSGDTLDELEQDIKDAIETYILALQENGPPVPPGHEAEEPNLRRWEIAVAS
ncbi:MAG: type II toxin-antitoxin system HicB family antitoxin [Dehalococcoidia bacterium]|nr:type II toxin-antitoxin system HicB family antitoxin [Dehalococcoidia bacterium]